MREPSGALEGGGRSPPEGGVEAPDVAAESRLRVANPMKLSARLAYTGALLSGLLYWLAFGGMDVWPLAFIAWVPLVLAMRGQTTRRSTLLGWLTGTTMNVTGFFWLQKFLETFGGFPAAICLLFVLIVCAYQGGRMALLGWLCGRASARGCHGSLVL